MGSILRFTFVGALGLLILLPLFGGNAADSFVASSKRRAFLSDIGLPAEFGNGMVTRLQEVRSARYTSSSVQGAHRVTVCWDNAGKSPPPAIARGPPKLVRVWTGFPMVVDAVVAGTHTSCLGNALVRNEKGSR
jgi:hypothetical protein